MGNLRVFFVGICSHLRENTSRETEHRVVMINAAQDQEINGHKILAHEAKLRVPAEKPRSLPLDGVRLRVLNASSPDVAYTDSFFTCIPRATSFAPNLPALAPEVVRGRDPELVAAYFDAAGRFSAGVDANGASVAILDVATVGDPILWIESFRDAHIEDIHLPNGAAIQIENLGPGADGDADHDFLLNFKIARSIPADAAWPTAPAGCGLGVELPFPSNTVGPGCSNSNYP